MKTIETQATVTNDGKLDLQIQLPADIAPGEHRIVLVIDEKPLTAGTSGDKKPVNVLKESPASVLYNVDEHHRRPEAHDQKLEDQQTYWYSLPIERRQKYQGQYVAVHNEQVVDSDTDQRSLYLRVHKRFGEDPVMIVHADWAQPPVYQIHSAHTSTS